MRYIVRRLHDDRIMLNCSSLSRAESMMAMMRRCGTVAYLESIKIQVLAS